MACYAMKACLDLVTILQQGLFTLYDMVFQVFTFTLTMMEMMIKITFLRDKLKTFLN